MTDTAVHLGISSKNVGYLVYITGRSRFTTASFNDTYFREHKLPRLDRIVGSYNFNGNDGMLPTQEQQQLEDGNLQFPELDDVTHRAQPPIAVNEQPPPQPLPQQFDETVDHFSLKQCSNSNCRIPCTNGTHDDGDPRHSFERIGDNLVGAPSRRTRAHIRNQANVVEAIDSDESGVLCPSGHFACPVSLIGDDPSNRVLICYNLDVVNYGDVVLPPNTSAALNGPQKVEWFAAYRTDLEAKIKNGTFTYVPLLS